MCFSYHPYFVLSKLLLVWRFLWPSTLCIFSLHINCLLAGFLAIIFAVICWQFFSVNFVWLVFSLLPTFVHICRSPIQVKPGLFWLLFWLGGCARFCSGACAFLIYFIVCIWFFVCSLDCFSCLLLAGFLAVCFVYIDSSVIFVGGFLWPSSLSYFLFPNCY